MRAAVNGNPYHSMNGAIDMRNIRNVRLVLAGIVAVALATPAAAVEMIATYKGTVRSSNDGLKLFGDAESLIGYEYTATYSYDTDKIIQPAGESDSSIFKVGPMTWSFLVNDVTLAGSSSLLIGYIDRAPASGIPGTTPTYDRVYHQSAFADVSGVGTLFYTDVESYTRSIADGLDFGQTISYTPDVGDRTDGQFLVGGYGDGGTQLAMNVTSVDIRPVAITSPVPEPASWMLMLTGFGAMGGVLRIRRRRVAFA